MKLSHILRGFEADIVSLLYESFDFVLGVSALIPFSEPTALSVVIRTDVKQSFEEDYSLGLDVFNFLLAALDGIGGENIVISIDSPNNPLLTVRYSANIR